MEPVNSQINELQKIALFVYPIIKRECRFNEMAKEQKRRILVKRLEGFTADELREYKLMVGYK